MRWREGGKRKWGAMCWKMRRFVCKLSSRLLCSQVKLGSCGFIVICVCERQMSLSHISKEMRCSENLVAILLPNLPIELGVCKGII